MKKNFIYSLCILLCGAIFMSSCEDMLEVDSDRVEYDMSPLTLNDTVYSVLGILKKVQAVADRQVLLGELRGDLMVVNDGSAIDDIKAIADFNYEGNNKYINVKDYYAIINNCNIYLARVDTTLSHNNERLMLREYVAVKSVRAWTYMQLALNYGKVPYFTEPILTHSLSQEIASRDYLGIEEIADALIKDLTPFADSKQYPMPKFKGLTYDASLYFMPIRQLLGDLYLWKKDYRNAVDCYYNLILENRYVVNASGANRVFWIMDEVKEDEKPMGDYSPLSSNSASNTLALVGFSSSTENGTVSDLPNIFIGDHDVRGSHQVAAAPALTGLSRRQTYYFAKDGGKVRASVTPNPNKVKTGDLRLFNYLQDVTNTTTGLEYKGRISKFGTSSYLSAIKLGRPVQAYLRLAEALAGLASEAEIPVTVNGNETYGASWENADSVAMYILRYGLGQRTFECVQNGIHLGLDKEFLQTKIEPGVYPIRRRLSDTSEDVKVQAYEKYDDGTYKLDDKGEKILAFEKDQNGNYILVGGEKVQAYEKDEATGKYILDDNGDKILAYEKKDDGTYKLDDDGEKIPIYEKDENGKDILVGGEMVPVMETVKVYHPNYEVINLDFTNSSFKNNRGIRAFGCGNVEWDESLSFENDSIIAAYLGMEPTFEPLYDEETNEPLYDEETNEPLMKVNYGIEKEQRIAYLRNLILDECALETALEGYRFTDLIRFAEAMGDVDVLAKRVASRGFENKVSIYYNNNNAVAGDDGTTLSFDLDDEIYGKVSNKNNWYLPLK